VRLHAARALGRLADADAIAPLSALLVHTVGNLRKEAAIALGEIGSATALPALNLAEADPDPDPEVRKAARLAIQRIGLAQASA